METPKEQVKIQERAGMVYESFDDIGVFTEPMSPDTTRYNFRAIRDYCRERNIDVSDMTFEEIEQFRSN